MNITITITHAIRALRGHKLRSMLTTLGIIIGVASIIAVTSISEGAKLRVNKEIESLGSNFIIVIGGSPKHRVMGQPQSEAAILTLKPEDLKAIRATEEVFAASGGVQTQQVVVARGANWRTTISGVEDNYLDIRIWPLASGTFFSQEDVRASSKVCVLGTKVAEELFGNENPIGEIVRVKNIPLRVLGVLSKKGTLPTGMNQDDIIFAPLTTIQRRLMGIRKMQAILVSAARSDLIDAAASEIRSILRAQHRLTFDADDDFSLFSAKDIAQASAAASAVLNLLLLIIASIALLVGGIGIMNIMLVTVSERTKEIGIRMALGATPFLILRQFIIESIIICLAGGIIGLTLGATISQIIALALGWSVFISTGAIIIALASSILVGLFFGFYPAYKASKLSPVDALADRG